MDEYIIHNIEIIANDQVLKGFDDSYIRILAHVWVSKEIFFKNLSLYYEKLKISVNKELLDKNSLAKHFKKYTLYSLLQKCNSLQRRGQKPRNAKRKILDSHLLWLKWW